MEGRPTPRLVPVQLPTIEARTFPVLRYSSLLGHYAAHRPPRKTRAEHNPSPIIRDILKEKRVRATVAVNGRELAVFGRDQEILDALATTWSNARRVIELDPATDSWAMGLFMMHWSEASARRLPLIPRYKRAGHSVVIASPREERILNRRVGTRGCCPTLVTPTKAT